MYYHLKTCEIKHIIIRSIAVGFAASSPSTPTDAPLPLYSDEVEYRVIGNYKPIEKFRNIL